MSEQTTGFTTGYSYRALEAPDGKFYAEYRIGTGTWTRLRVKMTDQLFSTRRQAESEANRIGANVARRERNGTNEKNRLQMRKARK